MEKQMYRSEAAFHGEAVMHTGEVCMQRDLGVQWTLED